MSVSTAIKNTILIILIILIGHFMVKNLLFERQKTAPTIKEVKEDKLVHVKEDAPPQISTKQVVSTPSGVPSSVIVENTKGTGLDKAKEELLKFINDDDDDIERFFEHEKQNITSDNTKCKSQDTTLPLSTTCDPAIQDVKQNNMKQVKADCNLKQDKKNILILKEYVNENTMNGGTLFGGLSAFDNYDNNYQIYSCA